MSMTSKTAVDATPSRNGAELLVESLEALGVEYLFVVPGGAILPILNVLADRGPRLVVCRDETGAAFMAQAWGRITGKPGVVMTTSGPGLINAVCGVATANEDRDPVIVITGNVSRSVQFRPSHMNLDSVGLYAPITKWSVEVEDANTIPEILVNAWRESLAHRSGAVHISVPVDISTAPVTGKAIAGLAPPSMGAAAMASVQLAARLLAAAKRPVMLLGVRASIPDHAQAVRAFLTRHEMATAMTFEASGTLSRELARLFVGRVGYVRNQPADEVLKQADVVLTVGYDSIEYDPAEWLKGCETRVIHLDAIPAMIDKAYQPSVELVGDIALNLSALAGLLPAGLSADRPEVHQAHDALTHEHASGARHNDTPIHPLRFIHDLRATLQDDVTVTCDVGAHEIWMARYFFCYQPRHLLFSMGHQTMGVALPWAIAAALARPGRKVVSVSGDGSFMMTCMELETAVRLQVPTVHIVWVDQGYNLIHSLQMRDYGRSIGADFGPVDFVQLAKAMGAEAYRVENPDLIIPLLEKALAATGPVVLEVPIDYRDNHTLVATVGTASLH